MAITLHPPENPRRFRITRTWKRMKFQRYVAIGKNMEKAREQAELLDEQLAQRQRAYQHRRELEGLHVLHPDGRIIGLLRQQRIREDRKPADAFKIRLSISGHPPVIKDFEINTKRSFDEAFLSSVQFIADLRKIERDSTLYKKMLSAKTLYEELLPLNTRKHSPKKATSDEDELFLLLSEEAARFDKQRRGKVIRG